MRFAERTDDMRASEIRELLKLGKDPEIISFAGGLPSSKTFPVSRIKKLCSKILKKYSTSPLQYGATEGINEARETLAKRMKKFGVKCRKENVIMTNGAQEALDLVTKIFVNPRDFVALEVPSYLGGICSFRNYQSRFLTVGMDQHGMKTGELEEKLRKMGKKRERVKLIYAIPNFHNPAGVSMSRKRRKHLAEIAEKYSIPVMEDDPYAELRYSGKALKSIKSLDSQGLVMYISSFSKIFAPGFRLGWIVAEKELARKITIAKQGTDLCTNVFSQYMASEYIESGWMDRQLPKTRKLYRKRRDVMLDALERYLPGGCTWTKPEGGMFLWATVPDKIDTKEMFADAVKKYKICYVHGAAFCVDGSGRNSMRLNFSYENESRIEEGIRRLGKLIRRKLS